MTHIQVTRLPNALFMKQMDQLPKPPTKTHSRYCRDAAALFGKLIRTKRIEHKLNEQIIVGIPLFEDDKNRLQQTLSSCESRLTLLPKSVRKSSRETKDDF